MEKAEHNAASAEMASAGSTHQPASPAAGANPAKTPAPSTAGRPSATVATISRGVWVTRTQSQMRQPVVTTRSTDARNGRTATVSNCQRHGLPPNEAGLGSAPMVHATAETDHPVRQGLYGIFEVFVDTILICTTTGLAILVTGAWDNGATGAALSVEAFTTGLPGTWGGFIVTTGLVLFAFSTLIGWSYYGETGIVYLLGARSALPYRLLWLVFIYLGATGSLHLVWDVADTLNGLMAIET